MLKKLSHILATALALSLIIFAAGCSKTEQKAENPPAASGQEEKVTIRLATQPGIVQPIVAQEKGYFKEEGLDVVLDTFAYGPPIIESITAKNDDFGFLGDLPAFNGIANGADIIIVGTIGSSDIMHGILVRNDANIKSLSDLKGKKIAVPFGSNVQPLVYLYLEKGGVKEDEVEIINLGATDLVAALIKGDIDAGVVWEPYISEITKDPANGVTLLQRAEGIKLFVDPLIARSEFTKKYPEQTAKLIRALSKAGQFATDNKDEAAQIMADNTELSKEAILTSLKYKNLTYKLEQTEIDALQKGVDQAFERDLLKKQLDIRQYIDTSYLKAAGIQ